MPDPVRSITFVIPGASGSPGVQVRVEEVAGSLAFSLDLLETSTSTADLRGLFFRVTDARKLVGLGVATSDGTVTELQALDNRVIDLGNGANMNGVVSKTDAFDVGVEFGSAGIGRGDDIKSASFTLSNTAGNLTLDDIAQTLFGARLTSVGHPNGARNGSEKLTAVAPAAPDARDDAYSIFEDGATGLGSPAASATGVLFQVLANDTDADGNTLTITSVFGAAHGVVAIVDGADADLLPGDALLYTPVTDYAGSDSFTYTVSDGAGGTDFAQVDVTTVAVADVPTVAYEILAGDSVNEFVIRVTATQTDDDGSEFIDRLSWSVAGGLPTGVTITPAAFDPGTQPGTLVQDFTVILPLDDDAAFDIAFTAVAKEISNGDEEQATVTVPVVYEYGFNDLDTTFTAVNQSMWGSGEAFTFVDDRFLGIDESWNEGTSGFVIASTQGKIKAGFQSTLEFTGGRVDAEAPYQFTVETHYNKTTDTLLITSDASLLSGGGFTTTGPGGTYTLDFIFEFLASLKFALDFGDLGVATLVDTTLGPVDETINILSLDSDNLGFTLPLPAGFSIDFAWPDLDTTSDDTNPYAASGASNDFLALNLDIDAFLTAVAGLPVNPVAPGFSVDLGFAAASFLVELLDLDVGIGLNFLQQFDMAISSLQGTITYENGESHPFSFGTDIVLTNASSYDIDDDQVIDFTLTLDPQATLSNDTELGFNFLWNFDLLKASGSFEIFDIEVGSFSVGPALDLGGTVPIASVDVYNNTFALDFGSQNLSFAA